MMAALNSPTVRTVTRTHDDAEKDVSDVTVNRWTGHGNDRLYLNGLFSSTTDVYVDLDDMTVTVSGTQIRSASVDRDGDELVVEIVRPSWNYEVVIGDAETEDTDTDAEEEDDDESGVDLERFGVSL